MARKKALNKDIRVEIKKSLGRYDSIRIAAGRAKNLIKKIVGSDNRIVIFQLGNPGIGVI